MLATERLVAILKATEISQTAEWYAAAGFDVRGLHSDGYFIAFSQ